MSKNIAVVGGGPGGYAAAFYAADLGMQVTLIDENVNPGGVCLYVGCIPSKALLHVAAVIHEAEHAKAWGVEFSKPSIDINRLRDFKNSVVTKLTGGLGQLSKQRKISYLRGRATLVNSNTVSVHGEKGDQKLSFDNIILATGSRPAMIPGLPPSQRIMDSSGALELRDVPKSLLVIGGGYIGLELGTVYAALGSKVTVVEMLPQILTGADRDLVNPLAKRLEKMFSAILLNTKVVEIKEAGDGIKVRLEGPNLASHEQTFDKVLVSVGRKPNTDV